MQYPYHVNIRPLWDVTAPRFRNIFQVRQWLLHCYIRRLIRRSMLLLVQTRLLMKYLGDQLRGLNQRVTPTKP
jgi:hypothetical protein